MPAHNVMREIRLASLQGKEDMEVFLGSSSAKATFDVSAGRMVFDGAGLRMNDSDSLSFGDDGDASINFDGTDTLFDNTGTLQLQWGGVGGLEFDDAAITQFLAADDAVGKSVFVETQDAGASPSAARVGGSFSLATGRGSSGASAVDGGASGALTFTTGGGGNTTGTGNAGDGGTLNTTAGLGGGHSGGGATGTGGAGGAFATGGGAGGATSNVGSDNAGAGGGATVLGGAGGAASAGTGDGGAGGNITLTPGAGGTSNGGSAGADGSLSVTIGHITMADGGTVTQGTSKAEPVTLSTQSGQITMHAAQLDAGVEVSFTVTNTKVSATDVIIINHGSAGTAGAYLVGISAVGSGSFSVTVSNVTAGNLSQAIVLNFVVIGGAAS